MPLNLKHPDNRLVLRYLRRIGVKGGGIHPDVLDQMIWLAAETPGCVRRSICTCRIIAQRKTGIIVAAAFGTEYCIRVGAARKEARLAGLTTSTKFTDGGRLNVSREFGRDWFYGAWDRNEPKWMQSVIDSRQK